MSGSDLFTGTLDLLILRAVRVDPKHGYAIGQLLRQMSGGVLDVAEGVMYPALHRLEERNYLVANWGRSETGRRAKYYTLTKLGRAHLDAQAEGWTAFSNAVRGVLDMKEAEGS